jgi:hypothetical protein
MVGYKNSYHLAAFEIWNVEKGENALFSVHRGFLIFA